MTQGEEPRREQAFHPSLREPLDALDLPTRMSNWALRNQVRTLGDLVRRDPVLLAQERNLGRKSLHETRNLVLDLTGQSWDAWFAALHDAPAFETVPAADTDVQPARGWDALHALMTEEQRATPLSEVPGLPARITSYAQRQALATVGELVAVRAGTLRAQPNLGRGSLADTEALLRAWVAAPPPEYPSFAAAMRQKLAALDSVERLVLAQRLGLHGPASTLKETGEMLGFSRERARQIEVRALEKLGRPRAWLVSLAVRLRAALSDGVALLDAVLTGDPWWDVRADDPQLAAVCERLLPDPLHVVEVGGRTLLSVCDDGAASAALAAMRQHLSTRIYPVELPMLRAELRALAPAEAPGLAPYLYEALEDELHRDADGRALAFGDRLGARAIAYLRERGRPVPIGELHAAVGRGRMPDEVIYFERGTVGLREHFEDMDLWAQRLVPLCVAIMREDPRQWSVPELLERVFEQARVPEWLGHWHLAELLRHDPRVAYLGRLRVALPDCGAKERLFVRDAISNVLASGPRTREELISAAHALSGASEDTLTITILQPPFVQLDATRIGLVDRDLPGGVEALAGAGDALVAELERSGVGLSSVAAIGLVSRLTPMHARWTSEMVRSTARADARLRLDRSGGIGLAAWEETGVATRKDIILACLEEDGGRTPIAKVLARIAAVHGHAPSRQTLWNHAFYAGVSVRGDHLLARSLADSQIPPPLGTSLEAFASLPTDVRAHLAQLENEQEIGVDELQAQIDAYVERFESEARLNELLLAEDVRAVAARARELLRAASSEASSRAHRTVQVACRYFVLQHDGLDDFVVGGLDDDRAVIEAAERFLKVVR